VKRRKEPRRKKQRRKKRRRKKKRRKNKRRKARVVGILPPLIYRLFIYRRSIDRLSFFRPFLAAKCLSQQPAYVVHDRAVIVLIEKAAQRAHDARS
jgi:hypothetical protein